jgi:hypothetical protein
MGAAPRGLPPGYGRGGGAPYYGRGGQRGSPVGGLVNIATNLLLQLPFSRCECEKSCLAVAWLAVLLA